MDEQEQTNAESLNELYFYREIKVLEKRRKEMINVVANMKTRGLREAKQEQEKIMEAIRVNQKAIEILKNYSNEF